MDKEAVADWLFNEHLKSGRSVEELGYDLALLSLWRAYGDEGPIRANGNGNGIPGSIDARTFANGYGRR